ncbi:MAG: GntG family PLP-dependent aldolase, partial [Gemmatimonadota bacterium]
MQHSTVVDLRSDTVTRPTAAMRRAIAEAEVGDDALGDDPTVDRLERRVADVLGKEAAVYFPSGIMANQTALIVLGRPGTEAICEASAHIFDWELGGAASNAGLQLRTVPAPDGALTADLIEPAIRSRAAGVQVQTSLIAVENTHNAAGGRIMQLDTLRRIRALAQAHRLPVHLDGARLWNAAAATGVAEADFAACADTVMVTLSKGLGCPVGSLLAGDGPAMQHARVVRRRLGGSMRQAGILAAAGLHALDHHRERLHEDHANARALARFAHNIDALSVVEPETNILMLDITRPDLTAEMVLKRLAQRGVLMTAFSPKRIRAVTHLDVDGAAIVRAGEALRESV